MPRNALQAKRNPWIAIAGALVFLALAIGLILGSGGTSTAANGYGGGAASKGGGPCKVGGYTKSCKGQVSNVTVKPTNPKKGAGFAVSFSTQSGGKYGIKAKLSGKKNKKTSAKTLESGVAGTGYVNRPALGKTLKAGKYTVTVSVKNDGKSATDKTSLKISK
jgi:hypothetical protein